VLSAALHIESAGTGPPLVLLHGWAMHSGLWGSLPARLAARYRVHAVDLPGHGHSAPVSPWTLASVRRVVAAAFAASAAPLTVFGWSLGALVALDWARAAPGTFARMVLVGATASFVARTDWPHAMAAPTLARFGDELAIAYRMTLLRFLTLQLQGSERGRAALAAMRGRLFERPDPAPETLAAGLGVLAEVDLRSDLGAIATPTLVVAGERDALTPAAAGAALAGALPNALYAEIAGAAHVPFLSHPEEFGRIVESFLGNPRDEAAGHGG
jgi:pimeloyl-[acyl-carrier protein] methyl ester esterase